MRRIKFFIYLIFLLLGGHAFANTGIDHSGNGYRFTQYIERSQPVKYANPVNNYTISETFDLNNQDEYIIGEGIDDEDANNELAKKNRLLARCNLPPSFLPDLDYSYNCSTAPQPFCSHLSYKYITLRVLRI